MPILLGAHPSPPHADPRDADHAFAKSELMAGAIIPNDASPSIADAHIPRVQLYQDCVGVALNQAVQDLAEVRGAPFRNEAGERVLLSPMYTYGWARVHKNPPKRGEYLADTGCATRSALAQTRDRGVVAEELWAENDENLGLVPPIDAAGSSSLATIKSFHRILAPTPESLRAQLVIALQMAEKGKACAPCFVMPIYENYGGIEDKVYDQAEGKLLGYHAQELLAYNRATDAFLIAGTWGDHLGDKGNFWISTAMIFQLGFEFWVMAPDLDSLPRTA